MVKVESFKFHGIPAWNWTATAEGVPFPLLGTHRGFPSRQDARDDARRRLADKGIMEADIDGEMFKS